MSFCVALRLIPVERIPGDDVRVDLVPIGKTENDAGPVVHDEVVDDLVLGVFPTPLPPVQGGRVGLSAL